MSQLADDGVDVGNARPVRRTLRDRDASARDQRHEDEQEGKQTTHFASDRSGAWILARAGAA
jgi:hypothetical protein